MQIYSLLESQQMNVAISVFGRNNFYQAFVIFTITL